MTKPFSIAIDGPAGAGKSSVAKIVAARLNAMYLDTGAMYRAIGLYYLRKNQLDQIDLIAKTVRDVDISVRFLNGAQHVFLGAEDVSSAIRTPEGSLAASAISAVREVRLYMVELQRKIAGDIPVVMDGRDIGTVILPHAQIKIFLTASPEERARRRYEELQARGETVSYETVLEDVRRRDDQDSNRALAPLKPAPDAVLVDTTGCSFEESFERLKQVIQERL